MEWHKVPSVSVTPSTTNDESGSSRSTEAEHSGMSMTSVSSQGRPKSQFEEKPTGPEDSTTGLDAEEAALREGKESEIQNKTPHSTAAREGDSDNENDSELVMKIGVYDGLEDGPPTTYYRSLDGNESLDERRKKASRRVQQTKAYVELLEDRILDLEKDVRTILGRPDPYRVEERPNEYPKNKSDIAILSWSAFSAKTEIDPKEKPAGWRHRPEVDLEPKSTIEILREEPRYSYLMSFGRRRTNETLPAVIQVSDTSTAQLQGSAVEPHRIRIRSKLLLKMIGEITGCRTSIGPHQHRLVLIRPFKLLVSFEGKLRSRLRELETLYPRANRALTERVLCDAPSPRPDKGSAEDTNSPEARDQLSLICEVLHLHFPHQLQLHRNLGHSIRKVAFSDLWYIFKPGYEVRTPGKTQIQLYRILKVTGGRELLNFGSAPDNPASNKLKDQGYSEGSFVIECFYVHFDGAQYGPVNATFQIRKFEGERDVTSLPIFPLACDPEEEKLRKYLRERGENFAELSNPGATAHREYKGLTLDPTPEQVESEVIIDFRLAFIQKKENKPPIGLDGLVDDDPRELSEWWKTSTMCDRGGCCGNDIIFADYEVDEKERSDFKDNHKHLFDSTDDPKQLAPEQRILLPPKVYGFVLRTRRWATFDIDHLKELEYKNRWEDLILEDHIKQTVLALVENHERPHSSQSRVDGALPSLDLIQGKGRGLIILLHGEPGVGKTSTAECVAAHTRRPLFPITCGDIGDKADAVEQNLEKNFQLAHKWGCVLLLDEADIFLSTRTEEDIQRNAIVSVFLRTLEYYSGILFLTTNRVGKVDRAFKSRIHVSLYYPKLDEDRTLRIWQNNLNRVREEFGKENKQITLEDVQIMKFAKRHYRQLSKAEDLLVWNGRQIRNAFQTAIALAIYEANLGVPVVGPQHFEKVAKTAKQFDKYLIAVSKGQNDTTLAQRAFLRDDDFPETEDESEVESLRRKRKKRNKRRNDSSDSEDDSSSDSELARSSKKYKR